MAFAQSLLILLALIHSIFPQVELTKTTRATTFLALVKAEWFVYELVPLLASEEATCLVFVASECDLHKLRRQLLSDASSLRHSSIKDLVGFAVERGWWKYASILHRECRRAAPHRRFVRMCLTPDDSIGDCYFAEWLWIQHQRPLKLSSDVMYAAVQRGIPTENIWLDKRFHYNPLEVIQRAASHFNVVCYYVYRPRMAYMKITLVKLEDRPFEAISWSDECETYCVVSGVGWLTPRRGIAGTYPLMDWAAEIGDFDLLELLCQQQTGRKKLCTSKALEFAAVRGDLKMVQWLFKYRFPTFYGVPVVHRTAATRARTNIIDWLCNERESVKKFPKGTIGNAVIAGQYETVRWLFEHYGDKFPRTEYFMDQAVGSGSVDVVRFLRDVVQCPLDETAVLIASHKGDLDLIKWFYGEYPDWEWTAMAGSLIETAAKNGNLPIVKWSVETLGGWSVMALMCALQRYHLEVLEYLHVKAQDRAASKGMPVEDTIYWPKGRRLLQKVLPGGAKAVVWLFEHFPQKRKPGHVSLRNNVGLLKGIEILSQSICWSLVRILASSLYIC